MPNEKNLKKNSERTPSERRDIARRGGLASGQARKRKKMMREWAEVFGSQPYTVHNADGSETATDYDGAVVAALYQRAIQDQDVRAAEFLAKITGQIEQHVKLDADVRGVQVLVSNPDTAEQLNQILESE